MKNKENADQLHALYALNPVDGRYANKTEALRPYLSEAALIRYRIIMELRYLIRLAQSKAVKISITPSQEKNLADFLLLFTTAKNDEHESFLLAVKNSEKKTNHDVKAVEYVIRGWLTENDFPKDLIAHVHFGLTSEDVNNIAYGHMLRDAIHEIMLPALENVHDELLGLARRGAKKSMLARTHGQPATPTTFGKEMMIYAERLNKQIDQLRNFQISVKLNGASGNYNGHRTAYPKIHWPQFAFEFIRENYADVINGKPYFIFNEWTNQIEDHDTYAELFSIFLRINTILKNFAQDMWTYISRDMVIQKKNDEEVGSSAMPHKVNPIDFENAEGNFKTVAGILEALVRELPVSRLQRDLSDSTAERNFGTALGHCLIGYQSLVKGCGKIMINDTYMLEELDRHPEVLAEPIQLVLKKYGIEDAYEQLKELTRGNEISYETLHTFIKGTELPDEEKNILLALRPSTYLGCACELANDYDSIRVKKDYTVRAI